MRLVDGFPAQIAVPPRSPPAAAPLDAQKTVSIDLAKRENGGFGLVPDYLGFRNLYWGQTQPLNYFMLRKMFLEVPEVFAAVKTVADRIVGDGWEIDSRNPAHKKAVEDQLKANQWHLKLNDIIFQQTIYGDAYLELMREGRPIGLSVNQADMVYKGLSGIADVESRMRAAVSAPKVEYVKNYMDDNAGAFAWENFRDGYFHPVTFDEQGHPRTGRQVPQVTELVRKAPSEGRVREFYSRDSASIRIDYNEHGEPVKYIQRVLHRRVDFYPDEMVHLPYNPIGGRSYGTSVLGSIVRSARIKFAAEDYSDDWLRRYGIPRVLYKISQFDKKQTEDFKQNLQSMQYNQDLIVSVPNKDALDASALAPHNVDMQWAEFLQYLREQIFIAIQVPPAMLGLPGDANRSTGEVAADMFSQMIKSRKKMLEEQLNTGFFTYDVFGFDDIEFRFKYDDTRETLRRAQAGQLLSTFPYVSPDEVRRVLALPPLEEIDPKSFEEGAKLRELMQPQPMNPAQSGGAAPNRNQDKQQNSERLNSERGNETRVGKSEPFILLVKRPKINVGTNTVPADEYPNSHTKINLVQHDPKRRHLKPYADENRQENPRVRQNLDYEPKRNSGDPELRYPFGAVEVESTGEPYRDIVDPFHSAIVREEQRNPARNSFNLNHDRMFPKDYGPFVEVPDKGRGEKYPDGVLYAHGQNIEDENEPMPVGAGGSKYPPKGKKAEPRYAKPKQYRPKAEEPKLFDPERDENNEFGERVWTDAYSKPGAATASDPSAAAEKAREPAGLRPGLDVTSRETTPGRVLGRDKPMMSQRFLNQVDAIAQGLQAAGHGGEQTKKKDVSPQFDGKVKDIADKLRSAKKVVA